MLSAAGLFAFCRLFWLVVAGRVQPAKSGKARAYLLPILIRGGRRVFASESWMDG
jgi:hypothetical protein